MWLAEVKAKAKCKNRILFSKDCLLLDELCQLIEQANRRVAVPVRTSFNHIGEAIVLCARTRSKYIGGPRAVYQD